MSTLYAKTAGGAWSAAGTWSNVNAGGGDSSGPPTAADDVIFELLSGNVTIDAAAVCRSINMTSGTGNYAGVLNHDAAFTLTIGDGTAGAGNVALKFVASTYTIDNATTSAIAFVSTSATQQDVDFASNTTGNVTYNASSNGSWKLTGTHNTGSTATVTLTKGTLDTNGQTCSWGLLNSSNSNVRTLTLGASAITMTGVGTPWTFATSSNLTFNANTSTITFTGATSVTFSGGSRTFNAVTCNNGGSFTVDGNVTCSNFTRTGTAVKTDSLTINSSSVLTVTGVFTIAGNSATNRVLLTSSVIGSARTITNSGATMTWSNCDVRDISLGTAFDASAITGGCGNCGGNTNITFTTPVTRYWVGGTGSWSATSEWAASSGGASGATVPLCHDDVVFDANSFTAGSQTCTMDMPRMGKNINWTGVTNTPTLSMTSSTIITGSLTLVSGMTLAYSVTSFEGRGSFTLDTGGKTFTSRLDLNMVGGTLTLQSALTITANGISHAFGTFATGSFSVTTTSYSSSNSNTRAITGTGTWTLTSTGTVWSCATSTNLTTTGFTSATIALTDAGASSKTFAGGGKAYGTIAITGGGAGAVIFTGANTFAGLTVIGGTKSITLPGSTTTTFSAASSGLGNSTNVVTFTASSGSATVSCASGTFSWDYISLTNIPSTGGASFYAGANSTDGGGNTGWTFTGPYLTIDVSDTITLGESRVFSVSQALSETLTLAETLAKTMSVVQSDAIALADARELLVGLAYSETLTLSDVVAKLAGKNIADSLTLGDTANVILILIIAITDSIAMSDALVKDIGKNSTDAVELSEALAKAVTKEFAELLGLADVSYAQIIAITAAVNIWLARNRSTAFGEDGRPTTITSTQRGTTWTADPQ